jgi:signal transduction histidine kinase
MEWKESEGLIYSVFVLFVLCGLLIFLFIVFQKKKNYLLIKQANDVQQFEKELGESQVEIREQTLRNISWELHDNIGQLLTLAKIQLQSVPDYPENIKDVNDNLTTILQEVRALSKVINPDYVSSIRLKEALQLEMDRFNRLNYIEAKLNVTGNYVVMNPKAEIIIFRILQEFFSNTIKHSRAKNIDVNINYQSDFVIITAADNGIGFDTTAINKNGIGLSNMKKRGALIKTDINLQSEPTLGTTLIITHKLI